MNPNVKKKSNYKHRVLCRYSLQILCSWHPFNSLCNPATWATLKVLSLVVFCLVCTLKPGCKIPQEQLSLSLSLSLDSAFIFFRYVFLNFKRRREWYYSTAAVLSSSLPPVPPTPAWTGCPEDWAELAPCGFLYVIPFHSGVLFI